MEEEEIIAFMVIASTSFYQTCHISIKKHVLCVKLVVMVALSQGERSNLGKTVNNVGKILCCQL